MSDHYTTIQDVFISDGVKIEFAYTRGIGNRWHVVAQVAAGHGFVQVYQAYDEKPESLEELIASHRAAVARLLTGLVELVAVKGLL